jgi:uncharacterized membrane protein HdeD (DUF308 family)
MAHYWRDSFDGRGLHCHGEPVCVFDSYRAAAWHRRGGHRFAEGLSGVIRILAGIILLRCIGSSVAIITLILAGYLAAEGGVAIFGALKLRGNAGWVWTLINGLASLVLGFMVFSRWPKNSVAVLGLLFGIHALFSGVSRLVLGLSARKVTE